MKSKDAKEFNERANVYFKRICEHSQKFMIDFLKGESLAMQGAVTQRLAIHYIANVICVSKVLEIKDDNICEKLQEIVDSAAELSIIMYKESKIVDNSEGDAN